MLVTTEKMHEVGSQVIQRTITDPEFRALALRDGSRAVEQVLGTPLPDAFKIRFVENGDATFTAGLPPLRQRGELSDQDLEAVAGGRTPEMEAIHYQIALFFAGIAGK